MRRVGGIWDQIIDAENLRIAFRKAARCRIMMVQEICWISGYRSGYLIISVVKSISRSGQYKWSSPCSSTFAMSSTEARRNQGKRSNPRNNSSPFTSTHIPCLEIFRSSTAKVFSPTCADFINVFSDQMLDFRYLRHGEPVALREFHSRLYPEFRLAGCGFYMNMCSWLFS